MTVRPSLGQDIAWRLEAFGYDLLSAVFRLMPVDVASALGGGLLRLLGPLNGAHRTARTNIKLVFPDMPEAEVRRLLDKQWENVGRTFAELQVMDRIVRDPARLQVVNRERLVEIAQSKKPVVFISGHFSNWEVMPAPILQAGVQLLVTYRAANNPYVDARIRKSRYRYGVRLFAPKGGDGARELLDALANGASVALMNDQKFNSGIAGLFFGELVHTAPGPTRLALRFDTVLQPMSVRRLRGARFQVTAHEPIHLARSGDRTADIAAGVARINAFVEDYIRQNPEEWFWVHKRWPTEIYRRARAA